MGERASNQRSVRRLNEPLRASVTLDAYRRPEAVRWQPHSSPKGTWRTARVEHVLDTWYVDEAWWGDAPVRRMYFECQLAEGTRLIAVYDLVEEAWYVQR